MSKHWDKNPVTKRAWAGTQYAKRRGGNRVCVVCNKSAMQCVEPPLCERHLEMVSLICQAERATSRRATLADVVELAGQVRGKMILQKRELAAVYREVMCNYWEKETK